MVEKTRHANTNYRRMLPFINAAEKNDGHIKCTAAGYMDLVIEKLYYNDCYGNPVYSFAHYGEQYGDLMRDPEVTFSVDRERRVIIPVTFENSYVGLRQEVFQERRGKLMYSSRLLKELDHFLYQWLNNIDMQGFTPDRIA